MEERASRMLSFCAVASRAAVIAVFDDCAISRAAAA
jgi:hypothetical protein